MNYKVFKCLREWWKNRNKRVNQISLPETYEQAIDFMCNHLQPGDVDNPYFHFSGGMAGRNTLGLWDKTSKLHQHMLERFGLCHADDTGALIFSAANAKLKGEPYDPSVDVVRFQKHWLSQGIDPRTMEHEMFRDCPGG